MEQYEFKVLMAALDALDPMAEGQAEAVLNDLGQQGYSVVSVVPVADRGLVVFTLQRPKQGG